VESLFSELQQHQPALYEGVRAIAAVWDSDRREDVLNEIWPTLPKIPIEPAVVEQAARVAVVPAHMRWSDVGDFNSLGELMQVQGVPNSLNRPELFYELETRDSVVWSETGRAIAMIGLENIVVVDTEDVLMIADRSRAQEVRRLLQILNKELS
jgi:mannose-1-phosphate guanylyltransferase